MMKHCPSGFAIFVYGNERISAAVKLTVSLIDRSIDRILDVGCGLGISAAEIVETRDWVDSPRH